MTIEEVADEIVRTLRPADPGSWDTNKLYLRERLSKMLQEHRIVDAQGPESAPAARCFTCGSSDMQIRNCRFPGTDDAVFHGFHRVKEGKGCQTCDDPWHLGEHREDKSAPATPAIENGPERAAREYVRQAFNERKSSEEMCRPASLESGQIGAGEPTEAGKPTISWIVTESGQRWLRIGEKRFRAEDAEEIAEALRASLQPQVTGLKCLCGPYGDKDICPVHQAGAHAPATNKKED